MHRHNVVFGLKKIFLFIRTRTNKVSRAIDEVKNVGAGMSRTLGDSDGRLKIGNILVPGQIAAGRNRKTGYYGRRNAVSVPLPRIDVGELPAKANQGGKHWGQVPYPLAKNNIKNISIEMLFRQ